MPEQIILDPSEVASERTALEITPWVAQDGIDWGSAEIEAFQADQVRGAVPVDYRVPNRVIEAPLIFKSIAGTTASAARAAVQAKLSLFQREGGWLKRVTNAGGTVFCDIVNASFRATSVSGWASSSSLDTEASFSLEAIPDFYGAETTLADHVETTAAELIFTEVDIEGDYPGRVRIIVDEDDAEDQRGLIWAFRSRHYDSASTAAMEYEAEELGTLDTAAKTALAGASGGTVVTHGTLSTTWTPVLSGRLAGATYPTHTGTYQMLGRVYSTSGTTVRARAVWDVGDLVAPTTNPAVRLPGASNFYAVDFGEIRIDPAPVGTHRWDYQIQATGDAGAENFSVDKIWIVNKDEGYGRLTAPINVTEGLATYSARSEFNTESGVISGDALAVGGTWTVAGDADDFSVASGVATRTATNDSSDIGHYAVASTPSLTNVIVRVDVKSTSAETSASLKQRLGLIARYTDTSNHVRLIAETPASVSSAELWYLRLQKKVAAAYTTLGEARIPRLGASAGGGTDFFTTLQLYIDTNGVWTIFSAPQGGLLLTLAAGRDTALATGGTLATGKVGIYDEHGALITVPTRSYDNFAAWPPAGDAVMFSSQSAQLTTEGPVREDASGTAYGPVAADSGDLPRIPPEGLEGRTTQVFLKGSRGDFATLPDAGLDDISARVSYRPSWLFIDE